MANLGPLTTTFTPSGTDCQSIHLATSSTNEGYWLQQGTISNCFPSSFLAQNGYYYSPGICPQSFTYACSVGVGLGSSIVTAATCCPSGFNCRSRADTDPNACDSVMTSDSSYIVDIFSYVSRSPTSVGTGSTFAPSGHVVFAKGLVVWRAETDAEWAVSTTSTASTSLINNISSITETTTTDSTRSSTIPSVTFSSDISTGTASSDLSTGTKVGIGVGISLGALLFLGAVVAAYLLGRRNRYRNNNKQLLIDNNSTMKQDDSPPTYELEEQRRTAEMTGQREPVELMGSH
ncbi:hypothetical protein F4804DRAFT_351374 [Jackrogersella minutella]|nr:hypothetical protein F4804DRAFT_351374 [Jackrogersella minutella]